LPYLEKEGFHIKVSSLLSNRYLRRLYSEDGLCRRLCLYFDYLRACFRRLISIPEARKYDLVVIEKELFPYLPFFFERLLKIFNPNIVVDYDDATFAAYHRVSSRVGSWLLKDKIAKIMGASKAVIVGNKFLEWYASRHNKNVYLVPTVLDLEKYEMRPCKWAAAVVLGWIGTPITARYLLAVSSVIRALAERHDLVLKVVGAPSFTMEGVRVKAVAWSEETEADELAEMDIGVMPLPDDEWERGKCGLKLLQYMASGVPAVASPVGANVEIIDDGVNGYLAATEEEWIEKLLALIDDEALRRRLGVQARTTVEERYSLQVFAPMFCQILRAHALPSSGKARGLGIRRGLRSDEGGKR